MKIARECIPYMARQAIEIAEEATPDVYLQEQIITGCLKELAEINFDQTAPEIAYRMHQVAKFLSNQTDPYIDLKHQYNKIANDLKQRIEREAWLDKANDPFDLSCRLAIAGNIIDFSAGLDLSKDDIIASVENCLDQPLFGVGTHQFLKDIQAANKILYLADNTGETLSDIEDKKIYYLLRAKCSSVAKALGCKVKAYVLTHNQGVNDET